MFIRREDTELQTMVNLNRAGKVLGFSKNQVVTADMVRERYSDAVKILHPDTGNAFIAAGLMHVRRECTLDDIRKAKDLILKHMGDDDA